MAYGLLIFPFEHVALKTVQLFRFAELNVLFSENKYSIDYILTA